MTRYAVQAPLLNMLQLATYPEPGMYAALTAHAAHVAHTILAEHGTYAVNTVNAANTAM